jgi:hypothetical protein
MESATQPVSDLLETTPQHNPKAIIQWIINIVNLLLAGIEIIVHSFGTRIRDLEATPRTRTSELSTAQATGVSMTSPSAASAAPASATPHDTAHASRRPSRCTLCHARGHSNAECRTKNPGDMRKRVARNRRIAKEVRYDRTIPPISAAPPSPFLIPQQYAHAAQIPMNYAALAADATELRRRAAQSLRDRRLRQRRPTTT